VNRRIHLRMWAFGTGWSLAALVMLALIGTSAVAAEKATDKAQGAILPRDSQDAGVFRGGLVYANYCVTCHGLPCTVVIPRALRPESYPHFIWLRRWSERVRSPRRGS